jgi:hypothetical protein
MDVSCCWPVQVTSNPRQQKCFNCETVSNNNNISRPTGLESLYVNEDETYQEMELETPIGLSTEVPEMISTEGDKINLEEELTRLAGKHGMSYSCVKEFAELKLYK